MQEIVLSVTRDREPCPLTRERRWSAGKKAYSSEFGNAAASKERFSEYLVGGDFESGLQEDTKRILALTA